MDDLALLLWTIIIVIITLHLYYFFFFVKSSLLEKKISKYTVKSVRREHDTIIDIIIKRFDNKCKKLSLKVANMKLFDSYRKNLKNYFNCDNNYFIASKIIASIMFGIITLLTCILMINNDPIFVSLLFMIVGYLVPDYINILKKKSIEKVVKKDLINVITIMNHAFESGKSIVQSIDYVIDNIEGPLQYEFKKIRMDLRFGLDLEATFSRFYERVPLEDVKYLTTSLIVFNKTGGNIVSIFKLVENNFYTRQKIEEELKATTGSARFMFMLLSLMPLIIVCVMTIFSPEYYLALFSHVLGLVIVFIIVFLYILYVYVIKKLMKIEYK